MFKDRFTDFLKKIVFQPFLPMSTIMQIYKHSDNYPMHAPICIHNKSACECTRFVAPSRIELLSKV